VAQKSFPLIDIRFGGADSFNKSAAPRFFSSRAEIFRSSIGLISAIARSGFPRRR
jgi:hypothetical protein